MRHALPFPSAAAAGEESSKVFKFMDPVFGEKNLLKVRHSLVVRPELVLPLDLQHRQPHYLACFEEIKTPKEMEVNIFVPESGLSMIM